jgi:energy-coupling factor transporter ATP-binding protein EcfA2
MILKSLALKNFAGLNRTIELSPGLNFLCGSAGSGKTSIIRSIRMLLGASEPTDLGFITLRPNDPSPEASLSFSHPSGRNYRVTRSWGTSPKSKMDCDGSRILKDEASIQAEVEKLLGFPLSQFKNNCLIEPTDFSHTAEAFARCLTRNKELFPQPEGFVLLDDPLAIMDSEQGNRCIKIIQEFSQKRQVVACIRPRGEDVDKLGGNRVNL